MTVKLLYLYFAVKLYDYLAQRRVRRLFYHDPLFQAVDQAVLQTPNPYKIPAAFPYGETPLHSLQQIVDRCGLTVDDRFVDLGCGRGRCVFFLSSYCGCYVHGVDRVASFIHTATHLVEKYRFPKVTFTCADMCLYDLSHTTCVFLYGTTLEPISIEQLVRQLLRMPPGGKIITVSYPLPPFQVIDQLSVSFPWGRGKYSSTPLFQANKGNAGSFR